MKNSFNESSAATSGFEQSPEALSQVGLHHYFQSPGTVDYRIEKDGAAAQLRCGQLIPLNPAYLWRIKSKALNCFAGAD